VTGVLDAEPDQHKLPKFKKLWERKFRTDVDYGELVYEEAPGVGKFVLLYSSQTGGAVVRTLDVYQVRYAQTNSERSARHREN